MKNAFIMYTHSKNVLFIVYNWTEFSEHLWNVVVITKIQDDVGEIFWSKKIHDYNE